MMCHHFQDLYLKDTVEIPREGTFPQCEGCTMQCNPHYPWHIQQAGSRATTQWDLAIMVALALLHELFYIEGELLEKVDLFQYLGWNLAQDNDDVRAVRNQIKKARWIWARVGQILTVDNTLPKVSTKFYKAVVQYVLLYGSKMWNLLTTALVQLEGFHICAAYHMAEKHKPKKGPHHGWVYPWSSDILQECGMNIISHYIDIRRATIFRYVVDRQSTRHAGRVTGRGDCHRDSGGGNRRCVWTTKIRTESMNNGTLVGLSDGI